jgi:hypothetical protein
MSHVLVQVHDGAHLADHIGTAIRTIMERHRLCMRVVTIVSPDMDSSSVGRM